ncbi:MAG: Pimeloyl-ACP methyl ester carboxylesterase [Nocardia sp.]|uniref:alpha/beta fold hydrolase n=1 Tax=Nocardia sp. TaxID=1821 RepID=UPI002628EEF2|nr:alpha/beta hydrolase [Nocardia sp.]MCU1648053.1 Pimeloyl-ACP methyl ester carboxylesterase [Nocardia sp.]
MSKRQSAEDYIDADSRFASVEGRNVHYKRAGIGPVLLLLHGSGSSLQGFDQVVDRLASSFEVIRPDLPGFGLTGPRADRDYRIRTYAKTVAAFLDSLDVPAASMAGNSLGGNVAWNFALDCPQRVQRLVLINATGYPDKSLPLGLRLARNPVARMVLRRLASRSATERNLRSAVGPGSTIVDDAMVDRVHAMLMRPGNQEAFIDFANTDQIDRSEEIPMIAAPTLVLRSGMIDGQHFARDIAGSRESIYHDGGHLLPEEAPEWVVAAIRDFLTAEPRRATPNEERP